MRWHSHYHAKRDYQRLKISIPSYAADLWGTGRQLAWHSNWGRKSMMDMDDGNSRKQTSWHARQARYRGRQRCMGSTGPSSGRPTLIVHLVMARLSMSRSLLGDSRDVSTSCIHELCRYAYTRSANFTFILATKLSSEKTLRDVPSEHRVGMVW